MTPSFLRSTTAACVLLTGAALASCKNQKTPEQKPVAPKSVSAVDRTPDLAAAPKPEVPLKHLADSKPSAELVPAEPKANPPAAVRGLVVEGEHFTPRI